MTPPKVLIVDDDISVRSVLSQIVQQSGCITEEAEDGEVALGKIAAGAYDAVFTDLMMPRLGGIDLVRRIRQMDPALPVVVLTGFPTMESGVSALREGATDFITKPFRLRDIKALLERLLGERKMRTADKGGDGRAFLEAVNQKLYNKIKHISLLSHISESIEGIKENSALLDWVVETAQELTGAREIAVGFLEDGGWFSVRRSFDLPPNLRVPIAGTPMEQALRQRSCVQVSAGEISPYGLRCLEGSLLTVPLMIGNEVIGFLNVSRKEDRSTFTEDEIQLVLTMAEKMVLKFENNALYESLYSNFIDTLKALVSTIEARDSYTKTHSERVTRYALEIAQTIGLSREESDAIRFACYLHDIGKIGVRDTVLLKPGSLNPEEFSDIRKHPAIGDNIVKSLAFMPLERDIIRHHHERWDGTGYPDRLRGMEIPLLARLVAVADTYDALTSTRPYRIRKTHEEAIEEIRAWSGRQFDPDMVEAFLRTATGQHGPSQ